MQFIKIKLKTVQGKVWIASGPFIKVQWMHNAEVCVEEVVELKITSRIKVRNALG